MKKKFLVEAWEHVKGDPPHVRHRYGFDGDHFFDSVNSTCAALDFVEFMNRESPGSLTHEDIGWDSDKWKWGNYHNPRVIVRVLEVKE